MSASFLSSGLPSSSWQHVNMTQGAAENTQESTLGSWCRRKVALLRDGLCYFFCCFNRNDSEVSAGLSFRAPQDDPPFPAPGVQPGDPGYCSAWCASVEEDNGSSLKKLKDRKCIYLATSANKCNVAGAVKFLSEQAEKKGMTAQFFQLPYNDLDAFNVKKEIRGPLILFHSIHNRRFAITNVMDSLYDKFINSAKKCLGRYNTAVVVHDFPAEKIDNNAGHLARMEGFWSLQYDAFNCSNLVLVTSKLANYDLLPENFKHSVGQFIDRMHERA